MPSSHKGVREELLARFMQYANVSDAEIGKFCGLLISLNRVSQRAGMISATEKYYKDDGTQLTIAGVPMGKMVEEVESHIKRHVPPHRRTEVYHKVLHGYPGHKETPDWDTPPSNPNEKPTTRYSKPDPGFFNTNQDLVDAFAAAAGFNKKKMAIITTQIAWWDAYDGTSNSSCMMSLGPDEPHLSGGRLGRDHTLEDVPVHYLRDNLLEYISSQMDANEEKKQAVRKAICPDLVDSQIKKYVRLVEEARDERFREEAKPKPKKSKAAKPKADKTKRASSDWSNKSQAVMEMEDALLSIDEDDIDMTPMSLTS